MNKRKLLILVLIISLLFIFSACSSKLVSNPLLNRILDNFTDVLKCNDKIVMTYVNALNYSQNYRENPSDENYAAAVDVIDKAINIIKEIQIPEDSCSDVSSGDFSKIGLDIIDYKAMFSSVANEQISDTESLENLIWSMDMARFGYESGLMTSFESFEYLLDKNNISIRILTQVTYYGVNYFLLDIDKNILSSYRADVLEQLESYQLYKTPWETDRSVIETKSTILLDQLDKELEKYSKYLADLINLPIE